jgi:branched-chain amino acid transport system substrate-binding protein
LVRQIHAAGADAILLVANSTEGKSIARAMASLPADQRLPIVSHWGITGGDFGEELSSDIRGRFPLCFIQTRFSFLAHPEDRFAKNVFERARRLFPDHIRTRDDFAAPTGFIHAYDLTRLLISAVGQAGLTGTIEADRLGVHAALEDLGDDVQGLIKNYHRPFRPFDAADPDAHEALDRTDLVFGRFRDDGVIALEETDH